MENYYENLENQQFFNSTHGDLPFKKKKKSKILPKDFMNYLILTKLFG